MAIPRDKSRIIDANLNRIGEGLRVIEEFARFSLNDVDLTQRLKNIRHEMVTVDIELQGQFIRSRDADRDIGVDMEAPGQEKARDEQEIIVANSRRVQESLRVMEEISKSPNVVLDSERYKQARFAMYTIEKELLSRLLRKDKIQHLAGLYVIIDTAFLKGRNHTDVAARVIDGGARIIQLRAKEQNIREFLSMAQDIKNLCEGNDTLFIINDSLDIALAVEADGLHIGQDDLPVEVARRLLPVDAVLGCSARTLDEARAAQLGGADYLGVGAMYATSTKDTAVVVGPERIREIKMAVDLPIVAIGGINNGNVAAVLEAGAISVALISAIMNSNDIKQATRHLVTAVEGAHNGQT